MPRMLLVAAFGGLTATARASAWQGTTLGPPTTKLREEFADIRGVRELANGRILVSDYRDQRVVLVDFDRATVTAVVPEGGGPLEARLPTTLVAAPGDSTYLVDLGNQRLQLLDPTGRAVRTIPGDKPGLLGLRGVGPGGTFVFAVPAWSERDRALPNDSVRIVRYDIVTGREETIAVVQGERMRSDVRRPSQVPRIPIIGYAGRDGWLWSPDGVRVVRAATYQVETWAAGKRSTQGPSYRFTTAAVTQADRLRFVREFNATSPTSGRGEGGGMGLSPQMTDREIADMTARTEFATHHPMFHAGRLLLDPDGQLWAGVVVSEGKPNRYDRFDRTGARVGTLELPADRRIAAIGRVYLYVIHESADGIERLERYRRP